MSTAGRLVIATVRCFIAVDLTMEVIEALGRVQRDLAPATDDAVRIRWVHPASLHLTLKFIGDKVDTGITVAIGDALRACTEGLAPFEIEVVGLGAFPKASRARVIWAEVLEPTGALEATWGAVEDAMVELGFDREPRGHSPHVTLGRVKQGQPDLSELLAGFQDRKLGYCRIEDLVLYRSLRTARGAHYEPIVRAPLTGEPLGQIREAGRP